MRILVANDDGPDSPWLGPLVEKLSDRAEVRVWVPSRDRSASGKASIFGAVEVSEDGSGYALVDGYPADAVQAGLGLDGPFDGVISGVNSVPNLGVGVALSSGTVGAALEAALAGVPAAAVSAHPETDPEQAAGVAAQWAGTAGLWNINVPPEPRGMKICGLRPLAADLRVRSRNGGKAVISRPYERWDSPAPGEDDAGWFAQGYITVTPLLSDLTDRRALPRP